MAIVTLAYDIDVGLQSALEFYSEVSSVDVFDGELAMLGMSLLGDSTSVLDAHTLRRTITLVTNSLGNANFPSAESLTYATRKLYRSSLNMRIPADVVAHEPAVATFTPLNITSAPLCYWWRADLGVVFDPSTGIVASWTTAAAVGGTVVAAPPTAAEAPVRQLANPNMNGQSTVDYDGSDWLDAVTPPSLWNFLHDGSGMSAIVMARPASIDPVQVMLSTHTLASNDVGFTFSYDGTTRTWGARVANGAAEVFAGAGVSGGNPNIFNYASARFLEGRPGNEWSVRVNEGAAGQGNTTAAPSAADATAALRLGASAVTAADPVLGMGVGEVVLYCGYVSDAELEQLRTEYAVPRYVA